MLRLSLNVVIYFVKMIKINKIVVFLEGDASKLSTWSNVPYFFIETLKRKGFNVDIFDISTWNVIKKLYNHSISKIIDIFFPKHACQFERTLLYNFLVERKLKKYIISDKNSDLYIIMNYTFYNKWNLVPTITFSDWSYDYFIKDRCQRQPYFFEKRYLAKQKKALENVQMAISLFEGCANYMKNQVTRANIQFLGGNVINMMQKPSKGVDEIICQKQKKIKILFIGMKKYITGAQLLVDTFLKLKNIFYDAELHIVGLTNKTLNNLTCGVTCHGYLHKDVLEECNEYYALLEQATIFVNPTEQWAGYSSMVEAMYFYTPIIVSPYKEFVEEFGTNIDFGKYNTRFSVDSLLDSLLDILQSDFYSDMCKNAHCKVENFTWDNYVQRLLDKL